MVVGTGYEDDKSNSKAELTSNGQGNCVSYSVIKPLFFPWRLEIRDAKLWKTRKTELKLGVVEHRDMNLSDTHIRMILCNK